MTAVTWKDQPRASLDDVLLVAAQLSFYDSSTQDRIAAYADPMLTVPLPNPLASDAAGRFKPIWLDLDIDTRAVLVASDGQSVWDVDPIDVFPGTESQQPLDDSGAAMPECVLEFYRAGTTILADIYDSNALTTQLPNPITADDDGLFSLIWLDDELHYRVRLLNAAGELIYDVDDYQTMLEVIEPSAPVLSGEINDDSGIQSDLEWTAAVVGSFPLDHYLLYRSIDGGAFSLIDTVPAADPREYLDTGQSYDTIYRYFVIAVDTQGNQSDASNNVQLSISQDVIVDVYTANDTWAKRPGLVSWEAYWLGAGGGGGSGTAASGGESRPGGGGGGGGGYRSESGVASDLAATESVVVGVGGAGGASAPFTLPGLGNNGSNGGASSFGAYAAANGGQGGRGGLVGSGPNGAGGGGDINGGNGGSPSQGGTSNGVASTRGGGGGGGGGGRWAGSPTTTNAGDGGAGNAAGVQANGGTGAGATNGVGNVGGSTVVDMAGGGGGGGGHNSGSAGSGGAAGAGGTYGAGGGGGGCCTNSGASGAGGDGASGIVVVINYMT